MPASLITYQKSKLLSIDPVNSTTIQIQGINPPSVNTDIISKAKEDGEDDNDEPMVMPNMKD